MGRTYALYMLKDRFHLDSFQRIYMFSLRYLKWQSSKISLGFLYKKQNKRRRFQGNSFQAKMGNSTMTVHCCSWLHDHDDAKKIKCNDVLKSSGLRWHYFRQLIYAEGICHIKEKNPESRLNKAAQRLSFHLNTQRGVLQTLLPKQHKVLQISS